MRCWLCVNEAVVLPWKHGRQLCPKHAGEEIKRLDDAATRLQIEVDHLAEANASLLKKLGDTSIGFARMIDRIAELEEQLGKK